MADPLQDRKRRLRVLVERYGGTVEYGFDGSLTARFAESSIAFRRVLQNAVDARIDRSGQVSTVRLPATHLFDAADRVARDRLPDDWSSLTKWPPLSLETYIAQESGVFLARLRDRLRSDDPPAIEDIGGDYYTALYESQTLTLSDLCGASVLNVVDFFA